MHPETSHSKASTRVRVAVALGSMAVVVVAAVVVYGRWARVPRTADALGARAAEGAPRVGVPPDPAPAPPRELVEMKDELARLRTEVGALRNEAARAVASTTPEQVEPLSRGEQETQFSKYMTEFDQRFRDEPRDHDWAEQASDYIREAAAFELVPAGLVADIDCRSRTCKVELADLDSRMLGKGVDLMIAQLAQVLPNARIGHGDEQNPKPNAVYFTRASPTDPVPAVARQ